MTTIAPESTTETVDQSVLATYRNHADAEAAVRSLAAGGIPIEIVSIIGRNFETHEDIQGFYRPADAAREGAQSGAWFGGIFGLMSGALGLFVIPTVGALLVLGPLAGLIAGVIGGAGVGALINGLVTLGIPKDQALKYQQSLQAGEFLVVAHGDPNVVARAHEILSNTGQTQVHTHGPAA